MASNQTERWTSTNQYPSFRWSRAGDTIGSMLAGILILACRVSLGQYWNSSARSIKPVAEQQSLAARLAQSTKGPVVWRLPSGWATKASPDRDPIFTAVIRSSRALCRLNS
jgi:hypothetical protein